MSLRDEPFLSRSQNCVSFCSTRTRFSSGLGIPLLHRTGRRQLSRHSPSLPAARLDECFECLLESALFLAAGLDSRGFPSVALLGIDFSSPSQLWSVSFRARR